MSCSKPYGDNFISARSSTKVIHHPGGKSSVGSLLFGPQEEIPAEQPASSVNKENVNVDPDLVAFNDKISLSEPRNDAEKVRQFTMEAGQSTSDKPQLMNLEEVNFITKMIIDELLELYATVLPPQAAKNTMKKMIDDAKSIPKMNVTPNFNHQIIAEQADALVDIYYYSLNCMAKKGVNMSKIFEIVHTANMAKRDPKTGKFVKRADGKIIKPLGWKAPNVGAEIKRQTEEGAWK